MAYQNGQYIPEQAIGEQYKFADNISNQKWAPTWAGVLAGGLGGLGGGIHRTSAQNALQGNQSLMADTLKNAGKAPDLASATNALVDSGIPSLQKSGVDQRMKMLADDPNKEYRVRAAQWTKMGYTPETEGYKDWVLTGKLPGADGSASFGKTGTIVTGPDGKFYSVRYASDGTEVINPLALPGAVPNPNAAGAAPQALGEALSPVQLAPAKGVVEVDTGTGTLIIDKATGGDVREINKDIRGAEAEKVRGKTQGEGEASLPKVASALKDYEIKNNLVMGEIDRALQQAGPWTTGFAGNLTSWVAGSPAHDLSKTLMGIQSNLGFETLQTMRDNSPTGGALGSITERELDLLQATWGSLVQSQSQEQFVHNLNRLKQIKTEFAQAKREAYARDVARFGAANVPNPEAGQAPDEGWTDVGGYRIREKR